MATDDENCIDVKFRYTFSSDESEIGLAIARAKELYGTLMIDQRTLENKAKEVSIGIEALNKCGEPTAKHLHINFSMADKIGNIRRRIQRFFKSVEEKRKGNDLYSCVEEKDVIDRDRFLRYPFKQCNTANWPRENKLLKDWNKLPDDFDYASQSQAAYEEWVRNVDYHIEARMRRDAKVATRNELVDYLDSQPPETRVSEHALLVSMLHYYSDGEFRSANKSTIMGYLNTAMLRYKLQSHDDMATEWLRTKN